jgi:hypothetical protein
VDIPQPSVIAFNTSVAGAAVVEFLRLVTAFAGADDAPLRLSFDFTTGAVRRNRLAASPACRICGAGVGAMPNAPIHDAGAATAGFEVAPAAPEPDGETVTW